MKKILRENTAVTFKYTVRLTLASCSLYDRRKANTRTILRKTE